MEGRVSTYYDEILKKKKRKKKRDFWRRRRKRYPFVAKEWTLAMEKACAAALCQSGTTTPVTQVTPFLFSSVPRALLFSSSEPLCKDSEETSSLSLREFLPFFDRFLQPRRAQMTQMAIYNHFGRSLLGSFRLILSKTVYSVTVELTSCFEVPVGFFPQLFFSFFFYFDVNSQT